MFTLFLAKTSAEIALSIRDKHHTGFESFQSFDYPFFQYSLQRVLLI